MSPPTSFISDRYFIPSLGVWSASSQMKFWISFVSASRIVSGIPCAFVRNWVRPPTIACTISLFPLSVGWTDFHLSRSLWMRSIMGSQGLVSRVLFPIHAPSDRIASPSFAIRTSFCIGVSSRWSFRVQVILSLCAMDPISIISVFSLLNFAPDTSHHLSRVSMTLS